MARCFIFATNFFLANPVFGPEAQSKDWALVEPLGTT